MHVIAALFFGDAKVYNAYDICQVDVRIATISRQRSLLWMVESAQDQISQSVSPISMLRVGSP